MCFLLYLLSQLPPPFEVNSLQILPDHMDIGARQENLAVRGEPIMLQLCVVPAYALTKADAYNQCTGLLSSLFLGMLGWCVLSVGRIHKTQALSMDGGRQVRG